MLTQDLLDSKDSFDSNNKPNNLTSDEENSDVKKSILSARVRQYIKREERIAPNMNIM